MSVQTGAASTGLSVHGSGTRMGDRQHLQHRHYAGLHEDGGRDRQAGQLNDVEKRDGNSSDLLGRKHDEGWERVGLGKF